MQSISQHILTHSIQSGMVWSRQTEYEASRGICSWELQRWDSSSPSKTLFLRTSLSWGRRLLSTCPIRGIPYLTDDSLLMMSPTGRMEFRSFLCFSIWHDCAVTERWEAGGLWITLSHSGLEKGNMKGAQLSGLECTSANWALMASNLILSWTARATLFLSNGSEIQAIADYNLISKSFLTFKCHLSSHGLTPIKMFTFHTYEFVYPILRIGLGQSFGLPNRDHLLVPAARHKKAQWKKSQGFLYYKQTHYGWHHRLPTGQNLYVRYPNSCQVTAKIHMRYCIKSTAQLKFIK